MLSLYVNQSVDLYCKLIGWFTSCGHKFIWNLKLPGINIFLKFVFVKLCDAYITHAATKKPYRSDYREPVPLIYNAQYTIKILVLIEKKM